MPGAPKDAAKAEFAKRLQQAIWNKGINQSELARRAQLELGETVRLARDSISTYIRGLVIPTGNRLKAIAKVLDVKPEDLLPAAARPTSTSADMRLMDDGNAWLRINQAVDSDVALKIMTLIHGNRKRDPE